MAASLGLAAGAASPDSTAAERDAFIQKMMRSAGFPGLQVAVVKQGRVVWSASYGHAVLDPPGPARAMRNDSILYTASIGKMLTAVLVMEQVEEGRLSLDDDIDASLPFTVRNPKWPDVPITWRMLLTHTSSLQDDDSTFDALYAYGRGTPPPSEKDFVEGTFEPGGRYNRGASFGAAKPGAEYSYCNTALELVGYALERVTDVPFETLADRALLGPLGIRTTGYRLASLPVDRIALGYGCTPDPAGGFVYAPIRVAFGRLAPSRAFEDNLLSVAAGADGGLYTSAGQFARFVAMLLGGGALDGTRILKASSVDVLLAPSRSLVFMGRKDLAGRQVWGHTGSDPGYAAAVFFDRETGVGAIAFANAEDPDYTLSRHLVDLDMRLLAWFR